MAKLRIQAGDQVEVIAGDNKGARGQVQRVLPKQNRVVVAGVNLVKKHQKPKQAGRGRTQGGIIEFEAAIDLSNVMLICPETNRPTRIGIRRTEENKPVRVSKRSGKDIE